MAREPNKLDDMIVSQVFYRDSMNLHQLEIVIRRLLEALDRVK